MLQVTGLRDILEESEDGTSFPVSHASAHAVPLCEHSSAETILFNHSPPNLDDISLQPPDESLRRLLLETYEYRVDKIFKVLHWPTVSTSINQKYANVAGLLRSSELQALEFAIYFAATCSVNEAESDNAVSTQRSSLIQRFRYATETALSKTKLLQQPSLTSLQAFVIYLVSRFLYKSYHPTGK